MLRDLTEAFFMLKTSNKFIRKKNKIRSVLLPKLKKKIHQSEMQNARERKNALFFHLFLLRIKNTQRIRLIDVKYTLLHRKRVNTLNALHSVCISITLHHIQFDTYIIIIEWNNSFFVHRPKWRSLLHQPNWYKEIVSDINKKKQTLQKRPWNWTSAFRFRFVWHT